MNEEEAIFTGFKIFIAMKNEDFDYRLHSHWYI